MEEYKRRQDKSRWGKKRQGDVGCRRYEKSMLGCCCSLTECVRSYMIQGEEIKSGGKVLSVSRQTKKEFRWHWDVKSAFPWHINVNRIAGWAFSLLLPFSLSLSLSLSSSISVSPPLSSFHSFFLLLCFTQTSCLYLALLSSLLLSLSDFYLWEPSRHPLVPTLRSKTAHPQQVRAYPHSRSRTWQIRWKQREKDSEIDKE